MSLTGGRYASLGIVPVRYERHIRYTLFSTKASGSIFDIGIHTLTRFTMDSSLRKWFIVVCVCIGLVKYVISERHPVKIDKETGELYYEEHTTTGIQKVVIRQVDVEFTKTEQKTVKMSGGIKVSKEGGVGIQFSKEKHWQQTVSYSRKGGKIELPMTESCLLDTGCRESVLGSLNNAIDNDGQKSIEKIN